jgi:ABC-2 type transport system ATP-binding protein
MAAGADTVGRMSVIAAANLVKRFGSVVALDGLDFEVPEATVLGLLGPNGAGKTTAVSILTTLLEPDSGDAWVAGFDVRRQPQEVRRRIGLSGQYAAVDEVLTGFENLDMIGRLYRLGRRRSRERAHELLERFDLGDAAGRPVKTYSGGMRRRLDVAGALVAAPPVLFLDEPTTGLDVRSRLQLWGLLRELVGAGATLLLTTQYLEEADQLADDILVIDHGRAIAHGTADELKAQVGGERVAVTVATSEQLGAAREVLDRFCVGEVQVDEASRTLAVPVAGGTPVLTRALLALEERGVHLVDAGLRRPTLDEVFLALTGRVAEPDGSSSRPDADGSTPSDLTAGPLAPGPAEVVR